MRKIIFLNEKGNPYYWTCPYCGANLDHGERCDCDEAKKDRGEKKVIKENWDNHEVRRSPETHADMRRKSSMRSEACSGLGEVR